VRRVPVWMRRVGRRERKQRPITRAAGVLRRAERAEESALFAIFEQHAGAVLADPPVECGCPYRHSNRGRSDDNVGVLPFTSVCIHKGRIASQPEDDWQGSHRVLPTAFVDTGLRRSGGEVLRPAVLAQTAAIEGTTRHGWRGQGRFSARRAWHGAAALILHCANRLYVTAKLSRRDHMMHTGRSLRRERIVAFVRSLHLGR
jgi:hypothetical protein